MHVLFGNVFSAHRCIHAKKDPGFFGLDQVKELNRALGDICYNLQSCTVVVPGGYNPSG